MADSTKAIKDVLNNLNKPSLSVNSEGWTALESVLYHALENAITGQKKADGPYAKEEGASIKISAAQLIVLSAALLTIYLLKRR